MKAFYRLKKGNVIAQYAIIIALVSCVVVPGFFLVGKNIVEQLTSFSEGLGTVSTENNSSDSVVKPPVVKDDSLISDGNTSGTGDVDINCFGKDCTIDFGDYTITGIPENFGEFVETSGASGGSEVLADLLEQIAKNPELTSEQSDLIERLANQGHSLSSIEEMIEDQAKVLVDTNSEPDEAFEMDGEVLEMKLNNFSDILAQLQTSLASTPETKALVDVLAGDIVSLATDMSLAHQVAINSCTEENNCTPNVLTGATVETEPYTNSLDDIINPEASSVSDLDSSLICASGGHSDDGDKCN